MNYVCISSSRLTLARPVCLTLFFGCFCSDRAKNVESCLVWHDDVDEGQKHSRKPLVKVVHLQLSCELECVALDNDAGQTRHDTGARVTTPT